MDIIDGKPTIVHQLPKNGSEKMHLSRPSQNCTTPSKPPLLDQQIELTIDDLGSHGEGVGRFLGYTVFVEGALPGETVQVQMLECHKRYGRGRLLSITAPSASRIKPPCPLFGTCGGCQLMHLDYRNQLKMKRQRVIDALLRIGSIGDVEVAPCEPSPHELAYRNKIQLPVRNSDAGIALGLYAVSSHDLVPISSCQIHCPVGDEVYGEVASIIKSSGILAYDPVSGKGELRHLLIKTAIHLNQVLVVLVTSKQVTSKLAGIAKAIMERCPLVKGVVHNINRQKDNVILGRDYHVLEGAGYIDEQLGDLTFKISPASFFQVNPDQAVKLYAQALAFADLNGQETVLDAYCGVGTLSLFFARHVKAVIGVECVAEAIADANLNARNNGIENVSFVCDSSEALIETLDAIDVAIVNPPRKGCSASFLSSLAKLAPQKVIYISCDPATLARDLAFLRSHGYRIENVVPFDMFPQTAHVETVVKLIRNE